MEELLTIFGCISERKEEAESCHSACNSTIPYAVGLYITSAYWFTASTSFANPAVTIARSLSDTFAGIAPLGVMPFIMAQLTGMGVAVLIGRWLWDSGRAGAIVTE